MSSVPITAPAYLSPLAPNKLPRRAVGVRRLNAPRVRALVEAASMIAAAAMRTIVGVGLARPAVARRRRCPLLRLNWRELTLVSYPLLVSWSSSLLECASALHPLAVGVPTLR